MKLSWLTNCHGWAGLLGALFCLLWFLSGMVMLFVPFPQLTEEKRLQSLPPIQWDSCCLTVDMLWRQIPSHAKVAQVRLVMTLGRPRFVAQALDGTVYAVPGDDLDTGVGFRVNDLNQEVVRSRYKVPAIITQVVRDLWTVQERFIPHRPLWKVSLYDDEGRELYLSSRTGEVVAETTSWQRGWNWVGAVVHWAYLPEFRGHLFEWKQTLSGLAIVGVVSMGTGLWMGIMRLKRSSTGMLESPYGGWWRWHHRLGLSVGFFGLTWTFSGLLTFDEGRWFSAQTPTDVQREQFLGEGIRPQDMAISLREAWQRIQPVPPVREVVIAKVAGKVHYVFRHDAHHQVVMPAHQATGWPSDRIERKLLVQGAEAATGYVSVTVEELSKGDGYYYSTIHRPRVLPVVRIVLDDPASTWLHIDQRTAQILDVMDRSRRTFRWIVNGLHSWDVGWLQEQISVRRGLVLVFLVLGSALTGTGFWIGTRRIWSRTQ